MQNTSPGEMDNSDGRRGALAQRRLLSHLSDCCNITATLQAGLYHHRGSATPSIVPLVSEHWVWKPERESSCAPENSYNLSSQNQQSWEWQRSSLLQSPITGLCKDRETSQRQSGQDNPAHSVTVCKHSGRVSSTVQQKQVIVLTLCK